MNYETIKSYAKKVDDYIVGCFGYKQEDLWKAAMHYMEGGGKRIRPYLAFKSYELIKGKPDFKLTVPIASAIELLHTYTLIHDDVMDKDEIRRGMPTVHKRWGEPLAILSGDLLLSKSMEFVNDLSIDPELKKLIFSEFIQVVEELCLGQAMDTSFEESQGVKHEDYIKMISLKTGCLIERSARIGALAGGAMDNDLGSMGAFGLNVGMSFQIVDDILGIVGDAEKFGKPIGSDLESGKKTLIVIHTDENLDDKERKRFREILALRDKSGHDKDELLKYINSCRSIEYAKKIAQNYYDDAIACLDRFTHSQAKNDLVELARLTLDRKV
ncbi:polyprenyl synthetase family protein [Spirochaetota bacterium]